MFLIENFVCAIFKRKFCLFIIIYLQNQDIRDIHHYIELFFKFFSLFLNYLCLQQYSPLHQIISNNFVFKFFSFQVIKWVI